VIPLCDLRQQYSCLKAEIDGAMRRVAEEGHYILGPNVKALEQEIAAYCGCRFAIGVASGTDALHLVLKALNIGPGDEVITTPFTFIATTEAISMVGATPVFVDIDPRTFNLDASRIEAAVTPRTKALLPVHLYGQPCDLEALAALAEKHRLLLIEDCAQAMGASHRGQRVGTFGSAGCLSFFPSKNLGGLGDGGMVVTNDERLYARVEMLRRHGGKVKYRHTELGLNSRLDELQAAVLRVKLGWLDAWNQQRRDCAARYNELLASLPAVVRPGELSAGGQVLAARRGAPNELLTAVYHQYTIRTEHRDALACHLQAQEIGCCVYYPIPLHLQDVNAPLGYREGDLPCAERAARQCLSLPIYPGLSGAQQEEVARHIHGFFEARGLLREAA